ncbi:hypothetical protein BJV78DRAFT_938014 [Lactifluus subvellereus]|nr:hypothetical protein BJV78DRAFT_938014 [Lactifluus subvellereus]
MPLLHPFGSKRSSALANIAPSFVYLCLDWRNPGAKLPYVWYSYHSFCAPIIHI